MSPASMSDQTTSGRRLSVDPAVAIAYGCVVALLLIGSIYSPNFLSGPYLLQQLKVASFLGIVATGMMFVILLGQIDLSLPWVLTTGAMMASAAAAHPGILATLSVPFGLLCGAAIGLVNGFAVAYMRVPSMIVTLATNAVAQGLMIAYTGGFSPRDTASPLMRALATGSLIPGVANGVLVWAVVAVLALFVLRRTTLWAFVISGVLSALGGVLLAGYSAKASQSMGDAYLLPAIAAVVLGGTHVMGGKGSYLGTIAGVILVTLLQSILSVMQIEESGRQLIYGAVIVVMLLLYGRQRSL